MTTKELHAPWEAVRHRDGSWDVRDAGGGSIALSLTERQARLIAAAPELFATVYDRVHGRGKGMGDAAYEKACAALAKASIDKVGP